MEKCDANVSGYSGEVYTVKPSDDIETTMRDAATSAMDKGWSPKISVKGDYELFARQPRKDKNKIRDRSPTMSEKIKKASIASWESNHIQKENDSPPPKLKDKTPHREDPHNTGVSVTNFPDGPSQEFHALSRLDSLPPRKQARIEHMKQLRQTPQENRTSTATRRLPAVEPTGKVKANDVHNVTSPHRNRGDVPFSPPVASLVDFLDNGKLEKYDITSLNKTILEDILRGGKIDPVIMTKLTTKFMVGYIKVGEEPPTKNLISSMVVRPILPPIKRARKTQEFTENSKSENHPKQADAPTLEVKPQERDIDQTKEEGGPWKNTIDMTYHFQRGSRLRQGHSKYVYRPRAHHSTAVLNATTNSPRELLDIGGEIEDDFDRVVRWKSKIRYCGKPVMYKRSTSPTLGEEALRRKLTDRLPTRQVHKTWPEPADLYSDVHDRNESWRRPPSNLNHKLAPIPGAAFSSNDSDPKAHTRGIAPGNMEQNNSLVFDSTLQHQLFGTNLPPPQIPMRKRRPMWQRMQPKKKFST